MARPRTPAADYIVITVRLPAELLDTIRTQAAALGQPMNGFLLRILQQAVTPTPWGRRPASTPVPRAT